VNDDAQWALSFASRTHPDISAPDNPADSTRCSGRSMDGFRRAAARRAESEVPQSTLLHIYMLLDGLLNEF
jgi:hypothetical protein